MKFSRERRETTVTPRSISKDIKDVKNAYTKDTKKERFSHMRILNERFEIVDRSRTSWMSREKRVPIRFIPCQF